MLQALFRKVLTCAALAMPFSAGLAAATPAAASPLRIGYSNWPGWLPWEVAKQKGWFKQAGIDVDMEWFDYSASLDAFSAGKLDAVNCTNGDALVTEAGGGGGKGKMILLTDYSDGNDMIVGHPGITSLADLKGKKVGVEVGLVEHLLLLNGLKKHHIAESDVTLVNTKTDQTPQVLASGQVAAIGAWQPVSGLAMKQTPGARPIYTSADQPGLIYDVLYVTPQSLAEHHDDYVKLMRVWYRALAYIASPQTEPDAMKIMSGRVDLTPAALERFKAGTHLIGLAEAKKTFKQGAGFDSLYGSSHVADDFNVKVGVYKAHQDINATIDPSMTEAFH
jgi:NitT/TauT family transport system substrate-binding protein